MTINEFLLKTFVPEDPKLKKIYDDLRVPKEDRVLSIRPRVKCADGFTFSAQAGSAMYTLHNGIDIRVSEDAGKAMWQRPLEFCDECEKIMSDLIEQNLHVPAEVTLSTDPKWG